MVLSVLVYIHATQRLGLVCSYLLTSQLIFTSEAFPLVQSTCLCFDFIPEFSLVTLVHQ